MGDRIVILAMDDFDVVGVSVALTDAEGNFIESREAVETATNSGRWVYAAKAEVGTGTIVRITVTATDRPGGVAATERESALVHTRHGDPAGG